MCTRTRDDLRRKQHVDKHHVTSLNIVMLRQTGVMRNMSQITCGQKRQRHVTLPAKRVAPREVMAPFPSLVEKTSCDLGFLVLSLRQEGRPDQRSVSGPTG